MRSITSFIIVTVFGIGLSITNLHADREDVAGRVTVRTKNKEVQVYWGKQWLARSELTGINYQPTEGRQHIHYYTDGPGTMTELLAPLLAPDDPVLKELGYARRGQDHARILTQQTGVHFIRLYYLPPGPSADVSGVIKILDRAYERYGLRVVLMHWAGLWDIRGSPELKEDTPERRRVVADSVRAWVKTYAHLKGLLYFSFGNENNYHVRGGPHTWRVLPMDLEPYYAFMTDLAVAAKEAEGEVGAEHPILLGCGAGALLHPNNSRTDRRDPELLARWNPRPGVRGGRAFDGLAVNFYGGRKPYDGPMVAIRDLYALAEQLQLPIFIAETGHWAMTAQDPEAAAYRDQLLPYLREAKNLIGVTWFEATDEGWKHSEDAKFNDELLESRYGVLGKKLQKNLFKAGF